MNLPRVSIIVTAYRESAKKYLDLCVESIRNLDYPKELLDLTIIAPKSYAPQYEGVLTTSPASEEYGMPHGLNCGIRAAHPHSEYFFVLNDDVILTPKSLGRLIFTLEQMSYGSQIGLLMPVSNDTQGRYLLSSEWSGPYKLEKLPPEMLEHMKRADSPLKEGLIFADTLCLYAFLMHRRVWDKVGPFDESLIGQDDIDYSLRVRQAGFINAIALDSLVWHAGGASNTLTDEQRAESFRIFNNKWASQP